MTVIPVGVPGEEPGDLFALDGPEEIRLEKDLESFRATGQPRIVVYHGIKDRVSTSLAIDLEILTKGE